MIRQAAFGALALLLHVLIVAPPALAFAQTSKTQIVMLGTGTPIPDPDRSGPAVAIVIDTVAYLFDAGTGAVRRASTAGRKRGAIALQRASRVRA